jgi:hypothetical protein
MLGSRVLKRKRPTAGERSRNTLRERVRGEGSYHDGYIEGKIEYKNIASTFCKLNRVDIFPSSLVV